MLAKRTVYLLFAMLLGMILGDIAYDLLEVSFLSSLIAESGSRLIVYGKDFFALRPLPEIVFDLAGVLGGYYAGKSWWRIIYIEDRRRKGYKLDW